MKIVRTLIVAAAALSISSLAWAVKLTADGEIMKVDKSAGTVTIQHGPPKEDAGAPNRTFTYDYKIPDAATLSSLQVGDKVSFVADDNGTNGQTWTVSSIQKR